MKDRTPQPKSGTANGNDGAWMKSFSKSIPFLRLEAGREVQITPLNRGHEAEGAYGTNVLIKVQVGSGPGETRILRLKKSARNPVLRNLYDIGDFVGMTFTLGKREDPTGTFLYLRYSTASPGTDTDHAA